MSKLEKVIEIVSRETGAADISAETSIDSLPMDSLEYMDLILKLEEEFGKSFKQITVHGVHRDMGSYTKKINPETIAQLAESFA